MFSSKVYYLEAKDKHLGITLKIITQTFCHKEKLSNGRTNINKLTSVEWSNFKPIGARGKCS